MLDLHAINRHYRRMLRQLPTTVTIGGVDYTGTRTQLTADQQFVDQGLINAYRFSVLLSQHDFRSVGLPAVNSTVTIDSTTYRILAEQEDAAGVSVRLDLGEQYASGKGAG